MTTFNIYCDESCHLENDHQKVMVLGAIWTPEEKAAELFKQSRELKKKHGLKSNFELKWSKVSPSKQAYYEDVLKWFWETDALNFRGLIVPDKSKLSHNDFGQTHDQWYYKMYFDMLKLIIEPKHQYKIYLDIKDTRGRKKVRKLHEVLNNSQYDFRSEIIRKIQLVRSEEVELVQLADFIMGIISYVNRGLSDSKSKVTLVDQLRAFSGYDLTRSTLLREEKLNLFRWYARTSK